MASPLDLLTGKKKPASPATSADPNDLRVRNDPTFTRSPITVRTYGGIGTGDTGGRLQEDINPEGEEVLAQIMRSCGYLGGESGGPDPKVVQAASQHLNKSRVT